MNNPEEELERITSEFWRRLHAHHELLYNCIISGNAQSHNTAVQIVHQIKRDLRIENLMGTYFRKGYRNAMRLPEREKCIELVITPLFMKTNIPLIEAAYRTHLDFPVLKNWTVIKYRAYTPQDINNFPILIKGVCESCDAKSRDVEINYEDFKYHPIVEAKTNKLNLLLFIADDKIKHLTKKQRVNNRDIFIPIDNIIHKTLYYMMGEYNLLKVLDKMELHPMTDLNTDDFKNIITFGLEEINNHISVIHGNPLSAVHKCGRCGYANYHLNLNTCSCKKIYYCDRTCQRAHWPIHKLSGCAPLKQSRDLTDV